MERTVELQPVATGSLLLVLGEERWSGAGRMTLRRQNADEGPRQHHLEFDEGRARVDDLLPGDYRGELELRKAGVLQGRAEGATVFLSFDARVEADQLSTQTLELR